jgi:hypothetical protein
MKLLLTPILNIRNDLTQSSWMNYPKLDKDILPVNLEHKIHTQYSLGISPHTNFGTSTHSP